MGCDHFLGGCDEAQMGCESLGSSLVSIHSTAENNYVASSFQLFQALKLKTFFKQEKFLHIVAADIDNGIVYTDPMPSIPPYAHGALFNRGTCIGLRTDVPVPRGVGTQNINDWYWRDSTDLDYQNWLYFDNLGDIIGNPQTDAFATMEDCATIIEGLLQWNTFPCGWVCFNVEARIVLAENAKRRL